MRKIIAAVAIVMQIGTANSFDGIPRTPRYQLTNKDWEEIIAMLPQLDKLEQQFEYQWRMRAASYCFHDNGIAGRVPIITPLAYDEHFCLIALLRADIAKETDPENKTRLVEMLKKISGPETPVVEPPQ